MRSVWRFFTIIHSTFDQNPKTLAPDRRIHCRGLWGSGPVHADDMHPDHLAFRELLKQAESDPALVAEFSRLMRGQSTLVFTPAAYMVLTRRKLQNLRPV